jgi:16S rRNA processing protein RimM
VGDPPLLEIGTVGRAHGLRGEVIVSLLTDRVERLSPGSVLSSDRGELRVVNSRPHQHRYLVQFDGVASRDDADRLAGVVLRAPADDTDGDELWVHQLIGAPVVTRDDAAVGVVESVEANPASDLLVLSSGALVPVVFVVERRDDGTVVIDPPDGLFDL